MSTFLPTLLTWLQQYSYPVLWILVCIAAAGVPLPMMLVLLAAGAFAALGDFNIVILALVAVTASCSGDSLGYLLGRRVGPPIFNWLARQKRVPFLSPQRLTQSQDYFKKHGAWAIFLSRFLFSGFGGPIDWLAGAERYPYRRFLWVDICGQILSALISLGLGYIFGASWEEVGNILGAISGAAIAVLITIVLVVRLIKTVRATQTTKKLEKAKNTVSLKDITTKISFVPQQQLLQDDTPSGPSHP